MKGWKEWLQTADKPEERSSSEDQMMARVKKALEEKLGRKLPDGAIMQTNPSFVELTIDHDSTEEDIARQIVKALRDMTEIVAKDMATKYNHNAAKLKVLVAEEYYRQSTAPSTFIAKNFGDTKLVQ